LSRLIKRLSCNCSDYLQGEAEGGFVCGFEEGLNGIFKVFASCDMAKVKHLPHFYFKYVRYGKLNGMSKRDWKIFMGSVFLANGYWTLACYTGITVFEWGWKIISK